MLGIREKGERPPSMRCRCCQDKLEGALGTKDCTCCTAVEALNCFNGVLDSYVGQTGALHLMVC